MIRQRIAIHLFFFSLMSLLIGSSTLIAEDAALPTFDELPAQPELPDALKMLDGKPVTSPDDWYKKRRPELKRLFQHYMYGYMPEPPGIKSRVLKTDDNVLSGRATLKEVEIRFANLTGPDAPKIRLAIFLPNKVEGRAPVFLALNKCGNHAVVKDPAVSINADVDATDKCKMNDEGRGAEQDFWAVETVIDRGYAFATFHQSDIDPDKHDFTDGIHPHYPDLPGPKESGWGTIAAWAWGLQRAVDYLVTDADIDPERICVTGHSRRGKTALLAGAFDERIALVVPHQSGTGGMALSRNNDQETVERINRVFPHWFSDSFTQFNDREEKLPIDQHLLMALVAPRALLDTEGGRDKWANFDNALRGLREADRVFKFLGTPGIVGDGLIEGGEKITPENAGNLVQLRLDTVHTLNKDYWHGILDFADVYFAGQKKPSESGK